MKNLCEPVAVRQISSLFLTGNIPQFSGKGHWHIVLRRRKRAAQPEYLPGRFLLLFPDAASAGREEETEKKLHKETKEMDQKKNNKVTLLLIVLCVVALAVAALFATGVIGGKNAAPDTAAVVKNGDVVGKGAVQFPFVIVDKDGNEIAITVKTDKKMVGEALLDEKIVEGDMGDYGLYVKKVNGIVADYDVDQTYWAFYIDGEYAMTGVDVTEITEGSTYMMKVEK